jgi:pantoate--beta-alanine ligase
VRRVTTITEVRAAVTGARAAGDTIGLVPTMGALHDGHLALVREAAARSGFVVVSVFVNPTQFDRPDDLAAYPRDLDGDETLLAALADRAPAVVFAPGTDEVYPRPPLTTVSVTSLTDRLCGASRPGHFDGVATVCTKLFSIVRPDLAVFGRKDFQQLQVVRRVVADLDLGVEVVAAPTVREHDGLALSSRNRRLDLDQRRAATTLSRALRAGVERARRDRAAGTSADPHAVRDEVAATLTAAPGVDVDYIEVVDPDTLVPPDAARGEAADVDPEPTHEDQLLVAVAAHVGPVRLIDNVVVGDQEDEDRLLAATT